MSTYHTRLVLLRNVVQKRAVLVQRLFLGSLEALHVRLVVVLVLVQRILVAALRAGQLGDVALLFIMQLVSEMRKARVVAAAYIANLIALAEAGVCDGNGA